MPFSFPFKKVFSPVYTNHLYSLDCIVTKLKETSEVMIHSIVIFMNLRKRLRLLLHSLFSWLRIVIQEWLEDVDYGLA